MSEKRFKFVAPEEKMDRHELPVLFRTSDKKYELLARLSYGLPSQSKVIDALLFPPGWQQRLGMLQKKQREQGISDDEFLHPTRKKERGIEFKPGRRKIHRGP